MKRIFYFKKTMKKTIFSSIFTFLLFASFNSSFAITERFPFFSDVAPDHYKFSAITELLHNGTINGYSDGTFKPEKSVSRAETLKILMEGSHIYSKKTSVNPFADVPKDEWFAKYVATAKRKNIIKGDGNTGLFYPARTVNKAEAIKMILEINNISVSSPRSNEQWFEPYFEKAIELGIIKDKNNAKYTLNRGDLVGLMYLYSLNKKNISLPNISSIEKLNAKYQQGKLYLEWENENNYSQYKIIAKQKNRQNSILTQGKSILIPVSFWKNFTKGDIYLSLEGKINGNYENIATIKIAAYERFTEFLPDEISEKNISWEYDKNIQIKFSSDKKISTAEGYVLDTHENLFKKELYQNGNNISLTFSPLQKDFYIIEIVDDAGLAKAILPITPKGFYPILPNNYDSITNNSSNISNVIQEINKFRQKNNRKKLISSESVTSLAQVRATDMKERNYFSHYSPEGKSANDMRSDYSIETGIKENIALHSDGIMKAAIGLEYSPTHRNALLSNDISFIGIGTDVMESGETILVELFQKTPLSSNDIKRGNQEIYNYIEKNYKFTAKSSTLENISKKWSKIMAEKNEANTNFSSETNWKNLLDEYNISENSGIFVLSHESPEKIIEYLKNNSNNLDELFKNKYQYGLSIQVSKEGIVYLTIISSK